MPELPEVETVKNTLEPIIKNQTIKSIDVLRNSAVVGNIDEFKSSLKNQTFLFMTRVGKFLVFHLTNNYVLLSHLRMEGKYYEVNENDENTKYSRVVFHLNNGKKICYDDSRSFGIMILSDEDNYMKVKEVSKLGPEPFNIDDYKYLKDKYKNNKSPIKSVLLDQSIMCGLGNIYADEVLFASKINPLTPANKITEKECQQILENSKRILAKAIELGGSTIKSFHVGNHIDGRFQANLLAYGHSGEKCPVCGSIMRMKKIGGRSSTYCPHCQVKKDSVITVAIFGKIASGKSYVLSICNELGYQTISCDAIVHELYKKPDIAEKVSKIAKIDFDGSLNLNLLRESLKSDKTIKRKIENYINPLVLHQIEDEIKNKKGLIFIEVPRLFEAKFDSYFDVILGVSISDKEQEKRLMERNPDTFKDLAIINANNAFEENKRKADFIIDNSLNKEDTKKKVINFINILKDRLD